MSAGAVIWLDASPGRDLNVETPAGDMWFENVDTAETELRVMFPTARIVVVSAFEDGPPVGIDQ